MLKELSLWSELPGEKWRWSDPRRLDIHELQAEELKQTADLSYAVFGREAWKERDLREALSGGHAKIYAATDPGAKTVRERVKLDDILPEKIADYPVWDVVGYAVFYSAADEGELNSIAVHPAYRRMGVAGSLLETAVSDLTSDGVQKLFLEVREHNSGAIAFYEKNGFLAAGVRRHFYDYPEEDAIVMVKTL